jgi:hypothetical protein
MDQITKTVLVWLATYYLIFRSYKLAFLRWIYTYAYCFDFMLRKPSKIKIQVKGKEAYRDITGLWYWDGTNWKEMSNIVCFTASFWRKPAFVINLRKAILNYHYFMEELPQTRTFYAIRVENYIIHLRISGHVDYEEANTPRNPTRCTYVDPLFDAINIVPTQPANELSTLLKDLEGKITPVLSGNNIRRKTGDGKVEPARPILASMAPPSYDVPTDSDSSESEQSNSNRSKSPRSNSPNRSNTNRSKSPRSNSPNRSNTNRSKTNRSKTNRSKSPENESILANFKIPDAPMIPKERIEVSYGIPLPFSESALTNIKPQAEETDDETLAMLASLKQ